MVKTQLYKIKKRWAIEKKIPIYFVAKQIKETDKAVYLFGHGTMETVRMNVCCVCGRTLTHPVSVELGIGPECGKHYWDWDLIGGYTKENLERLKGAIKDIKVDTWLPKSVIKETRDTDEEVIIPKDHSFLKNNGNDDKKTSRGAMMVRFGLKIE